LVLLPIDKNVVSLRLENIADFYDSPDLKPQQVNLSNLAQALWTRANPTHQFEQILITEMSLTGNQPLKQMLENKIKWKTHEDSN
jgi:hypothetical protein